LAALGVLPYTSVVPPLHLPTELEEENPQTPALSVEDPGILAALGVLPYVTDVKRLA
jgi:hypothetical protein